MIPYKKVKQYMSWYGNTNLILVQPQAGFFHNSELLSKSVKVVVPAWKEGRWFQFGKHKASNKSKQHTAPGIPTSSWHLWQPRTRNGPMKDSWGLKSLSFLSDVFLSKKSLYLAVFLSYFICIYIYIHILYTFVAFHLTCICLRFFDI